MRNNPMIQQETSWYVPRLVDPLQNSFYWGRVRLWARINISLLLYKGFICLCVCVHACLPDCFCECLHSLVCERVLECIYTRLCYFTQPLLLYQVKGQCCSSCCHSHDHASACIQSLLFNISSLLDPRLTWKLLWWFHPAALTLITVCLY